jgi:hypothetical protein
MEDGRSLQSTLFELRPDKSLGRGTDRRSEKQKVRRLEFSIQEFRN